jgi:hypothetical protein
MKEAMQKYKEQKKQVKKIRSTIRQIETRGTKRQKKWKPRLPSSGDTGHNQHNRMGDKVEKTPGKKNMTDTTIDLTRESPSRASSHNRRTTNKEKENTNYNF